MNLTFNLSRELADDLLQKFDSKKVEGFVINGSFSDCPLAVALSRHRGRIEKIYSFFSKSLFGSSNVKAGQFKAAMLFFLAFIFLFLR
jgi:hypothetical protein